MGRGDADAADAKCTYGRDTINRIRTDDTSATIVRTRPGNFAAYSPPASRSRPVPSGPNRTRLGNSPHRGCADERLVPAGGGRSSVRTWVGLADGFTDHWHIVTHLRQCSEFPIFTTYSPGDLDRHACANDKDALDVIHLLVATDLRR